MKVIGTYVEIVEVESGPRLAIVHVYDDGSLGITETAVGWWACFKDIVSYGDFRGDLGQYAIDEQSQRDAVTRAHERLTDLARSVAHARVDERFDTQRS